jgi:acetylornithine deacetylase
MSKDRVVSWIDSHQADMVSFLQKLIQIPSVTGSELAIQDFLEHYLNNLGFTVDRFVPSLDELRKHPGYVKESGPYENRPNIVATCKGTGGGRSILFNGHVDVIPEGSLENWEHGPWSGEIDEGRMFGRGASDMKSGVAAFTMAIKAIKESNISLMGDIIAEYVMDEELTGNGTLACVIKGYEADAGICCETSSMHVQPGSIGRIWFDINIKGKAAGIQRRYEGVNAIELGYIVTKIVSEFESIRVAKVKHPMYPNILEAIPCMIGQFLSGTYHSAFPDNCVLKGSMATVPGEDSPSVKKEFIDYIAKRACEEHQWFETHPPEVVFNGYFAEPSAIPENSPIVETLCENYKFIMGEPPSITGRQGAADIRHLNTYGHTPTVIFGPGRTEQMHSNNEWVLLEDYMNSIKVLACAVLDWCAIKK